MTTTPARTAANRQNAKRSTGPRTDRGKQRSARNSVRHGLSMPAGLLPEMDGAVARMARRLAGVSSGVHRLDLACRVAEAQVDLQRVRAARLRLLQASIGNPQYTTAKPPKASMALNRLAQKVLRRPHDPVLVAAWQAMNPITPHKPTEAERIADTLAVISLQLTRLDCYERRALSRRKFAVRAFDKA